MTTEIWCAGQINLNDLQGLIEKCNFQQDALFLAENLPGQVIKTKERLNLLRFDVFSLDLPFTHYTSGRVFQSDAELRWEKNGQMLSVVYMGPEQNLPGLEVIASLTQVNNTKYWTLHKGKEDARQLAIDEKRYFLFGERLSQEDIDKIGDPAKAGDFAEVRIARLLRYPSTKKNIGRRVQLVISEFVDQQTGEIELFRFQSLEQPQEQNK